jgi:hypothetical protein
MGKGPTMSQPRWRHFLPDRSQLWILAAVLLVMVAGVSFFNVFAAKATALANQRQVQAQLDRLAEQNRLLQERVSQAQAGNQPGGDVEVRARQYFGLGYPGETRIVGQEGRATTSQPTAPITTTAAPSQAAPTPFWEGWWKTLRAGLTNSGN